jgi:hypothetical protein
MRLSDVITACLYLTVYLFSIFIGFIFCYRKEIKDGTVNQDVETRDLSAWRVSIPGTGTGYVISALGNPRCKVRGCDAIISKMMQ